MIRFARYSISSAFELETQLVVLERLAGGRRTVRPLVRRTRKLGFDITSLVNSLVESESLR